SWMVSTRFCRSSAVTGAATGAAGAAVDALAAGAGVVCARTGAAAKLASKTAASASVRKGRTAFKARKLSRTLALRQPSQQSGEARGGGAQKSGAGDRQQATGEPRQPGYTDAPQPRRRQTQADPPRERAGKDAGDQGGDAQPAGRRIEADLREDRRES